MRVQLCSDCPFRDSCDVDAQGTVDAEELQAAMAYGPSILVVELMPAEPRLMRPATPPTEARLTALLMGLGLSPTPFRG